MGGEGPVVPAAFSEVVVAWRMTWGVLLKSAWRSVLAGRGVGEAPPGTGEAAPSEGDTGRDREDPAYAPRVRDHEPFKKPPAQGPRPGNVVHPVSGRPVGMVRSDRRSDQVPNEVMPLLVEGAPGR